jgi:hypothetical protein
MTFYTYAHSTTDGKVFYVGKGVGDRAYSKSDRSLAWKEVVKKSKGYAVALLADWQSENDAYEHEKLLIECFRSMGHNLVNLTSGGKGVLDYCQTEESRELRRKLLTGFVHKQVTCPNCGHSGGETSMKRWHFENCKGYRPFKARATKNGVRVYLGMYATKAEADMVEKAFKEET